MLGSTAQLTPIAEKLQSYCGWVNPLIAGVGPFVESVSFKYQPSKTTAIPNGCPKTNRVQNARGVTFERPYGDHGFSEGIQRGDEIYTVEHTNRLQLLCSWEAPFWVYSTAVECDK